MLLIACAAPQQAVRAPAPPVATPASSDLPQGARRRVRSRALDFPVEFTLAGKDAWRIADGPSWLVAEHAASGSRLAVRTWRADRLVRRADCVEQARLARPTLPLISEDAVIERRAIAAPVGFDTELTVGVEPSARGLSGYALAIGFDVGRCYLALFSTEVSGREAERELAARLEQVVDQVLSQLRVVGVDDRAVRRRMVSRPRRTAE